MMPREKVPGWVMLATWLSIEESNKETTLYYYTTATEPTDLSIWSTWQVDRFHQMNWGRKSPVIYI
jgi:hypothetical protein